MNKEEPMRMIRSEEKVPDGEIGASNKHGPPVSRPPTCWLHIPGKPRTRDPVRSRAPARNTAPTGHLQLVLVIRPPSLLWKSMPQTKQKATLQLSNSGTKHLAAKGERYGEEKTKLRAYESTRRRRKEWEKMRGRDCETEKTVAVGRKLQVARSQSLKQTT